MSRRTYTDGADTVIARRIASAANPEKRPVSPGFLDRHLAGIPAATEEQCADALAYLTRNGATDIAEILGLVEVPRRPALTGAEVTMSVACPVCSADAGRGCTAVNDGAPGRRLGKPHSDRMRAAKGVTQ